MTELEQKAEEYAGKKSPNEEYSSFDDVKELIKQSYKDGYKQGQKELKEQIESLANINIKAQTIIAELKTQLSSNSLQLEKENEELKAKIKILEDRICSLRRKNASLENKVEKMKCCYNCMKYQRQGLCEGKIFGENCDKWELTE